MCLCLLSVSVCLTMSDLYVSMSVYAFVSVYVFISVLYVSVCVSVSVCLYLWFPYLCPYVAGSSHANVSPRVTPALANNAIRTSV